MRIRWRGERLSKGLPSPSTPDFDSSQTTFQRTDVSALTMSPMIRALSAQLFAGDLHDQLDRRRPRDGRSRRRDDRRGHDRPETTRPQYPLKRMLQLRLGHAPPPGYERQALTSVATASRATKNALRYACIYERRCWSRTSFVAPPLPVIAGRPCPGPRRKSGGKTCYLLGDSMGKLDEGACMNRDHCLLERDGHAVDGRRRLRLSVVSPQE